MTDTQPSGAESALDLDKTIWDAVTRLERQDSTYEQRIAAADGLRALARRATAPHAGSAPGIERPDHSKFTNLADYKAAMSAWAESMDAAQPVEAGSAVLALLATPQGETQQPTTQGSQA